MKKTDQTITIPPELEEFEVLKTCGELAKILNLSTRRIRQLSEEGIVSRDEASGKYFFVRSVYAYIRFLHENDQKAKSTRKFQDARADKESELARALKRKRLIDERFYISREDYGKGLEAAMHIQSREFTILLNKLQRLIPGMSDSQLKAIERAIVNAHNAVCTLKIKHDAEEEFRP